MELISEMQRRQLYSKRLASADANLRLHEILEGYERRHREESFRDSQRLYGATRPKWRALCGRLFSIIA